MNNKGPWLVFICYFLFGILPVYWKFLVTVDSTMILANRVIWSLVFALILLVILRQTHVLKAVFKDRRTMRTLLISGVLIVVNWGSYIIAVNTDHVIDASLAYYLNPLMSILIGCFFFKEQLTGLQKLSVALAAVGVLYAIISYGVVPWLALVIGGSFAAYGAIKKTVVLDGITSLAVECLWMLIPALVMLVWLFAHGQTATPDETIAWWQWLLLPTTGIITGAPLVVFAKGIQTTSYSLSGILMYINPTLQLLCGIFLFHEAFTHIYAVMFAFVWAGVILYIVGAALSHRSHSLSE
ncbi:MAG: EamA family transporter RarD [Peptococcaceae bacterium]|nr:EamA family transporter RarD [Peptococcaceae bacterium]